MIQTTYKLFLNALVMRVLEHGSIEWELKCACVGGDSSVPLGFVSLSENLFMIAGALIMLFL